MDRDIEQAGDYGVPIPGAVITDANVRSLSQLVEQYREALDETAAALAAAERDRDTLKARVLALTELVEEALHLATYGERAPGGNETWANWAQRVEAHLRAALAPGSGEVGA